MKSTVSSRGQITIPVAVQRALGMRAGTPVEFELREDGVLMRKRAPAVDPFDTVTGILKGLPPTDVLMRA
ncbi:MAG: AbrB/MazE/SpoVT family DNA-binding domain-containing protein, partial [Streptosporangiaceae bacterium]